MTDRKYVRVYYSIINDERFEDVYHDARVLGSWLQLLLVADAMYPADAPLPSYVSRSALKILVAAGLVELCPHQHFRVHGLGAERALRSEAGRNAAAMRWHSVRNADPMPRRDEHRRDEQEQSSAAPGEDPEPEFPVLQWLNAHGCYVRPGNGYHQKLVVAVERHDPAAMVAMLDRLHAAGVHDGDVKGLLFGAIDALDAATRPKLDNGAAERAVRSKRIDEAMWKRRVEQYRFAGTWDESWGAPPEANA